MSKNDKPLSAEDKRYHAAKKRVHEIKEFYEHLSVFVIVISCLTVLNFLTTSFPWILFPMFGWGIGLAIHWATVFGYDTFLGKDWEQRKLDELLGNTPSKAKRYHVPLEEDYFDEEKIA